eukprot:scaffold175_cov177-Amphora_coffeaeformis.AAC.5
MCSAPILVHCCCKTTSLAVTRLIRIRLESIIGANFIVSTLLKKLHTLWTRLTGHSNPMCACRAAFVNSTV